jgi:hypothetical protein
MILISIAFLGIACAYYPYNTPVPDNQDLIFEVFSVAGVNCGNPPVPSTFTISEERPIVMIATYHWCDGEDPGTISLQEQDGTIYGPWQAMGRDGSGGAPNRYWERDFKNGLNLPAGTYTIVDSRPETWSWTEDVGNRGYSFVFALKEETNGSSAIGGHEDTSLQPKTMTNACTVFGAVLDEKTYEPILGATVSASGVITRSTDGDGKFILEKVPPGLVAVTVSKNGYVSQIKTIDLTSGGDAELDFQLQNEEETDGKAQKDESEIMNNWNIGSVDNNPTCNPSFAISEPQMITYIDTYHWNYGSGTPSSGTIALRKDDGTEYGPWQVETKSQGGVLNTWWIAYPNEVIPAGTYIVIDSEPDTWSQNSESPCGFTKIEGHPVSENTAQENKEETSSDQKLFLDGFEWTVVDDPSPSEPSQWVVQNGTLQQLSNIFRKDREYEFWQGTHVVAGSLDWTDYILSFDMTPVDDDGVGALVRYQDKDNYYRFVMVQDSANQGPFRLLEKFVNGERIVLANDSQGYIPGKTYQFQFKVVGDSQEVWMSGERILTAKDDTFKSGKLGFMAYASPSLTIQNIKVLQLAETDKPQTEKILSPERPKNAEVLPAGINNKNVVPAGAEDSKNVVMMAAEALKTNDVKAFMKFFTNGTVAKIGAEFSIPPEDASKVAESLNNARVVEVYPLIVLYEMEIDEKVYNFYVTWEGDEWKLNGF